MLGQTQIAPQGCSYLAVTGFFSGKKNNAGPDPKLEGSVYSLLDERGAHGPASLPFLLLRVKDLWQNEGSRQCCDPKGCALWVLEGPQGLSRAFFLRLPPQPSPPPLNQRRAPSAPGLSLPNNYKFSTKMRIWAWEVMRKKTIGAQFFTNYSREAFIL